MTVALAVSLGACAPEPQDEGLPPRGSRYGVLADLVLHPRPARLGGPFFLDRFESTRADWERYLTETERPLSAFAVFDSWNQTADPSLPVVGVDFDEARRYARWRFGRLPRLEEWDWAASAGGAYRLPWGDAQRAAWANSHELGFARLTPVGAFESGRSPIGCYDLVGNAAEWTVTPWPGWLVPQDRVRAASEWFAAAPDAVRRVAVLDRHPALAPWTTESHTFPLAWLWAVDRASCPLVSITGFTQPLAGVARTEGRFRAMPGQIEPRTPRSRSNVVGVRVATDAATLLETFASADAPPTPAERRALARFLRREEVRDVLSEHLARHPDALSGDGPVAAIVRAELVR